MSPAAALRSSGASQLAGLGSACSAHGARRRKAAHRAETSEVRACSGNAARRLPIWLLTARNRSQTLRMANNPLNLRLLAKHRGDGATRRAAAHVRPRAPGRCSPPRANQGRTCERCDVCLTGDARIALPRVLQLRPPAPVPPSPVPPLPPSPVPSLLPPPRPSPPFASLCAQQQASRVWVGRNVLLLREKSKRASLCGVDWKLPRSKARVQLARAYVAAEEWASSSGQGGWSWENGWCGAATSKRGRASGRAGVVSRALRGCEGARQQRAGRAALSAPAAAPARAATGRGSGGDATGGGATTESMVWGCTPALAGPRALHLPALPGRPGGGRLCIRPRWPRPRPRCLPTLLQ
ncbi:unnamed protein product, partial [Closterium sp. NIES-54]